MKRVYDNEGDYGKYIMQELKLPSHLAAPEALADYEAAGKRRLHWMDSVNMPGSVQIQNAWYVEAGRDYQLRDTDIESWPLHVHDTDEILGYYGSDPADFGDLGGEIEMIIDDEIHVLTKSSTIYIPAGIPHSTPILNRVDHPIFHFAMVLSKD